MSDYEVAIEAYIFSCEPKIAKQRITKDLNSNVKRADSIQFIDEQYEQYQETMIALDNIETEFYRTIEHK